MPLKILVMVVILVQVCGQEETVIENPFVQVRPPTVIPIIGSVPHGMAVIPGLTEAEKKVVQEAIPGILGTFQDGNSRDFFLFGFDDVLQTNEPSSESSTDAALSSEKVGLTSSSSSSSNAVALNLQSTAAADSTEKSKSNVINKMEESLSLIHI